MAGSVSKTYDNNFRTGAGSETLTRNPANGLLTGTVVGVVNDAYSFNGFAEITAYTAQSNSQTVYSAQFTRDVLG